MKVSGSIYSNGSKSLLQVVRDLDLCHVDFLHVDCTDDLGVFDDIRAIRKISSTPIDLHIISNRPEKFFNEILSCRVENVSFQFEDLEGTLQIPDKINARVGLAVMVTTPIDHVANLLNSGTFGFILLMTTTPGVSGEVFDPTTYSIVRDYQSRWPEKAIFVDGGVNNDVAKNLRDLRVECAVSGSYLIGAKKIADALLQLTSDLDRMNMKVQYVMDSLASLPVIPASQLNLRLIIQTISSGKGGYCLIVSDNGQLMGVVTDGDLRSELLRNLDDLNKVRVDRMINFNPLTIDPEKKVSEAFEAIHSHHQKIMFLPVVDSGSRLVGTVSIGGLIRG